MEKGMNAKVFINNVLNGSALGIIIGVLPNPIVAAILGLFGDGPLITLGRQMGTIYQMATPIFIGALVAMQFKFPPLRVAVVAGAAFLGSGVVRFNADLGVFVGAGAGDILNTMLTAAIAVGILLLIGKKFGSTEIVFCSLLVGIGVGFIGALLLPHVSGVTRLIGHGINTFTELHPFPMSILLGMSGTLIILSPLSTVAIGLAIGLSGLAAAGFSMGVAAVSLMLVVNSWKINKPGVTLAAGLGAMKMFMPNLFRTPIMLVPAFFTAAVAALPVALFNIQGTPTSSGFGIIGLLGPLTAIELGSSLWVTVVSWFIVPTLASVLGLYIFEKGFKMYNRQTVFGFSTDGEAPAKPVQIKEEKSTNPASSLKKKIA
ncbi:MAG: PTS sugar transporter subunit IIC [Turicibacter sp.]|nr:PTS sugar transporter subunit IIC [Turicibacter sp.]